MNCEICECGAPLSNLGHACTTPFGVPVMAVLVPTRNAAGVANGILKTQTLNKAYFDLMTSAATPADQRWYPTPEFTNVENTRPDPKMWESDRQTTEFVTELARKFKARIGQESGTGATAPAMKKQIDAARCSDGVSVFLISAGRQILVKESADGLSLLPIEVDAASIYASLVFGTPDENQHILFSFNFSSKENDGGLKTIECSDVPDYDILSMRALVNICYELVNQSVTTLKLKLKSDFGSALNPYTADGLVVTDFVSSDSAATSKIYNATDDSDVTISSVVESPAGTYLLTFVAQDPGDVLVPYALKAGFDFTCMKNNPVDVA